MASKSFEFLKMDQDATIPLPDMKEIEKIKSRPLKETEERPLNKHDKAYDEFCKWYSVPKYNRVPKTEVLFEKKYHLPFNYCSAFKKRDDFYTRYYRYMFEWIRELYPGFIQNQYIKATKDGNSSSIKFFGEMVAKDLDVQKPKPKTQPFMIIGVSQEKINKLFIPDKLEEIEDITPNG